jgi:glycosyltransferase involved in cell wall biosynthesis
MATVCALNNYPLEKMWELSRIGSIPRQHVWGVDALAAEGHVVDIAPFHEPSERNLLDRLSSRSRGLLGHLDQESYAIRRIRTADVLFCADQVGLAGVALARAGLPPTRIISVVHHPLRNVLRRAAAARHDVLVCLSPGLCAELMRDLPRRGARMVHLPWGPDLQSPLYRPGGEENGVVSAGKSNRDLLTITTALERAKTTGVVYDLERQLRAAPSASIRLVHPGADGVDPESPGGYLARHVIGDIAAASIVAIPMRDPLRLTGLTEAIDALALAKPILATRSPYFPFDIEEVGCGRWIDPGDVDGWSHALAELMSDADARAGMGAAGRRFAERGWNYETFCDGLSELIGP